VTVISSMGMLQMRPRSALEYSLMMMKWSARLRAIA
jgi:hypothetical protein